MTAIVVVGVTLILNYNPRIKAFANNISNTKHIVNPNTRFGFGLRILSWETAVDIIKDNWLIGVGEGNKKEALSEAYIEKGYTVPADRKYNTHNQFLDIILGGGIIGISIFCAGLIHLLIMAIKRKNMMLQGVLILFVIFSLFENTLGLYSGVLFISCFIPLGIQE